MAIADTYAKIFNGAPYFEDWTLESSLNELDTCLEKQGFEAVIAENSSEEIVGFTWCYKLPAKSVDRIDFQLMNQTLIKNNLDPKKATYGAEMGVLPAYRKMGVATNLLKVRLGNSSADMSITRTKNLQMCKLYEKAIGKPILSFAEESSYKGGKAYVYTKII